MVDVISRGGEEMQHLCGVKSCYIQQRRTKIYLGKIDQKMAETIAGGLGTMIWRRRRSRVLGKDAAEQSSAVFIRLAS